MTTPHLPNQPTGTKEPITRLPSGRLDVYQTVTDRLIAALEAGVVPWVRPWTTAAPGEELPRPMPYNGYTRNPYAGINVLLLWLTTTACGYRSSDWYTVRQANLSGAHVRKGEHGTLVTFWRTITVQDDADTEDLPTEREVPLLRHYIVFNREQLEGLPAEFTSDDRSRTEDNDVSDAAHRLDIVEQFVTRTGAVAIEHPTACQPCYRASVDRIYMPPLARFTTHAAFYATLLHEVAHWTGHERRLHRPMGGTFGTPSYAREELTAEITSAFLCADFALPGDLQHPEYIGSWLQVLRDDNRAVFRAAREARQAVAYLYALTETPAAQVVEGAR